MSFTVTLPLVGSTNAEKWALENCPSYIRPDWHQDGYNTYDVAMVDYFFADEKEALMFFLRWS
jgi:hypothetical protein